ncbi:MAG TPA: biotin--[acetyl-CoA-carboxylase] ligase [Azoarcus sp.]|nr:biotin--[acetyl-CoA-carboxylase] ligase [Azoarcus sp.]
MTHSTPETLAAETLTHLGPCAARFALEVIARCASTNDEITRRPKPDGHRIAVLVALDQHAGRGRHGRSWLTNPGAGLTFSCAWPLAPDTPPPAALSLATGLAVAEAITALGIGDVQLKWPNDILISGRKLGGILIELVSAHRRTRQAVIGIGINLLDAPKLSEGSIPATALAEHVIDVPSHGRLLAHILVQLASRLDTFAAAGFPALRDAWQHFDACRGQNIEIIDGTRRLTGTGDGVDPDGALRLLTSEGLVRIFAGEVSLRFHP